MTESPFKYILIQAVVTVLVAISALICSFNIYNTNKRIMDLDARVTKLEIQLVWK